MHHESANISEQRKNKVKIKTLYASDKSRVNSSLISECICTEVNQ